MKKKEGIQYMVVIFSSLFSKLIIRWSAYVLTPKVSVKNLKKNNLELIFENFKRKYSISFQISLTDCLRISRKKSRIFFAEQIFFVFKKFLQLYPLEKNFLKILSSSNVIFFRILLDFSDQKKFFRIFYNKEVFLMNIS